MKKLLSLVLCALLLLTPMLGAAAEEDAPLMEEMWGVCDLSFLVDWGVLTPEEAALLTMDRTVVAEGRELVRTATVETGTLYGDVNSDQQLAELASRMTVVSRSRSDGGALEVLLDGQPWMSAALGAQDGGYVVDSSLLPDAVSFKAEELTQPGTLMRLTGALQSNGLISRDDALVINMMLLNGGLPWPMSMMQTAPALAEFDLSAWNAVLEGVGARREYTNIPGGGTNPAAQPEGCDPAARVWTMDVTPRDLRDMIVAALMVVRDNPALGDQLAALTGFEQTANQAGSNVTFNDAFINPLLKELEGAEELMPVGFRLRGYEDKEGSLVRLEVEVLNTEEPEPEVMLMLLYNRVTTGKQVTHEVLFGDDKLEAYASLDVIEPHGMYARTYDFSLGAVAEDGQRTEHFRARLTAVTNRGAGLTEAGVQLSLLNPLFTAEERMVYDQQDVILHLSIVRGGVMERYPEDCVMIIADYNRRIGAEQKAYVHYYVNYAMEGADLKGTERFTASCGGTEMLSYTADIHTQAPEGGLFEGDAICPNALTDEELAAWVGGVKETVEAWLAEVSAELPAFLTQPDGGQAQDDPS